MQFAGFPRSGHSLIGALLNGHPQAAVAHELDLMGLFRKGLTERELGGLILHNAVEFGRHGQWWNGFRYASEATPEEQANPLCVIGDKKGDWATRWCAEQPDLITRFAAECSPRSRWIMVSRHPFDNVATMSLRKGGEYDRLRIDHSPHESFQAALAAAQTDGKISAVVSDEMVQDYRALSSAVAEMEARVPAGDWHEIVYEDFVKSPADHLPQLAAFLGLAPTAEWISRSSAMVRESANRSRFQLEWRDDQKAALRQTIAAHDFLRAYSDDC